MTDLIAMLVGVTHLPHSAIAVGWEPPVVTLTLGNMRSQRVRIRKVGDYFQLSSIVLGQQQTRSLEPEAIVELVWGRNHETDVVAFGWDERGRLIGRVDQLAATMDAAELFFYLEVLAQECDRLEWLLTGEDQH